MRIKEFDLAKGIACVFVVMGHTTITNVEWWNTICHIVTSLSIHIFLFVSGFIYMTYKKEESYISFLGRKAKRLLIPYLVVSLIILSLKMLWGTTNDSGEQVNIWSFVKVLYYPEASYMFWFIWTLLWMFCIIPFFRTRRSRTILFLITIILRFTAPYYFYPTLFCLGKTEVMAVWFMLGVFCHDFKLYPSLCKNVNLLYISLIFTSVVLFYILTDFRFTNEPLTVVGIWFILALCIFISSGKIPKWLTVLSACSYTIYLFHSTFIGVTKAVLTSTVFRSDTSEFASNAMIIFLVLSGVIGPIVLKYCISKFKTKFS